MEVEMRFSKEVFFINNMIFFLFMSRLHGCCS